MAPSTQSAWPLSCTGPRYYLRVRERRSAEPFRPEEGEAEADEDEVDAERRDEKHEHACLRERLEGEAIEQGGEGRHDQHGEGRFGEGAELERRERAGEQDGGAWQHQGLGGEAEQCAASPLLEQPGDERGSAQPEQQPGAARQLALVECAERESAVGHDLAGRDEDDARDGEHEHEGERQQRVDRAVDDAVLQ